MPTSHTDHPDSLIYGLADNCPRCLEHAIHPIDSLDDAHLLQLYERWWSGQASRSEAEAQAVGHFTKIIRHYNRLVKAGVLGDRVMRISSGTE